jgi:nitrogen fixation/metabolism regulation signal transduction histidine kinase
MQNHNIKLTLLISLLSLCAAGVGFGLAAGRYWAALFCLIAAVITGGSLIAFHKRTIGDLRRFVNAIRYEEFNISFHNHARKGLDREIGLSLETAIAVLDEKMQRKEARLNFYDLLLNRIDFAILVVNADGTVNWINKAAINMLGRIRELPDLLRHFPDIYDAIGQLSSGGIKTVHLSDEKDNEMISVSVVKANIRKDNIRIISLKNIQSVIDETESEAWKKLVRIMRHEIMNSMAPIISLSETFSDPAVDYDPELLNKTMQTIYRRSIGLVEFVQNYKSLTNLPAPQFHPFEVEDMLDDIANLLEAQQIRFDYVVTPPGMELIADRTQMEQVLINLIKNAREAVDWNESPLIQVTATYDEKHRPRIAVSDNGEGILPSVREQIFIPFFSTKTNGSGIGLSLCKQIIHAHGGHIHVTSTLNEGSCFTIRL